MTWLAVSNCRVFDGLTLGLPRLLRIEQQADGKRTGASGQRRL